MSLTLCALAAATLAACGGSPARPTAPKARLVDGEAVYELRYNPPRCVTAVELHFEVQTPLGWERVSLENADEEADLVGPLTQVAGAQPEAPARVRGVIVDDGRPYGAGHVARVLRLLSIDPDGATEEEAPPEEPPAEEPPAEAPPAAEG